MMSSRLPFRLPFSQQGGPRHDISALTNQIKKVITEAAQA
jgi:hypothetical protein